MYIDSYEIVSLGTKYRENPKGKDLKNQVLTRMYSEEGIQSKKLLDLLESYDDNIHYHEGRNCKVTIEFKEIEWVVINYIRSE